MRKEMHIGLKASVATSAVVILSLLFNRETADPELGVGTPDEIRIGGVMPYLYRTIGSLCINWQD